MNLQLTEKQLNALEALTTFRNGTCTRDFLKQAGIHPNTLNSLERIGLIRRNFSNWEIMADGKAALAAQRPQDVDQEDEQQPPAVVTLAADEFHDGMGRGYCPCCLNTCFYTAVGGTGKDYGLKHSASSGAKDDFRKEAIYGEFIFEKPGVVYWHCSYEGEDYETFDNALSLMLDDIAYIKAQISQPAPVTDTIPLTESEIFDRNAGFFTEEEINNLQMTEAELQEFHAHYPPINDSLNDLEKRLELTEEQWLELTEGDNGFQDGDDFDPEDDDDDDWDEGDHNWDDDDLRPYPDTPLTHNRLIPNSPGELNGVVDTEFQSALADLFCNKMVIFIHADGEIRLKPRRGGNAAVSA